MERLREKSLDNLTISQLENKKRDIMACLSSAKSEEKKEDYQAQLDYVDQIVYSASNLSLVLTG